MDNSDELIRESRKLKIACTLLGNQESLEYINNVIKKFTPQKTSGHLSIYNNESVSISSEKYEFLYSDYLDDEPVYVFFDQENHNRNKVVVISEGKRLCRIMENTYGMEYFVSNKKAEYLLAINWYVIEGAGTAKQWLLKCM